MFKEKENQNMLSTNFWYGFLLGGGLILGSALVVRLISHAKNGSGLRGQ